MDMMLSWRGVSRQMLDSIYMMSYITDTIFRFFLSSVVSGVEPSRHCEDVCVLTVSELRAREGRTSRNPLISIVCPAAPLLIMFQQRPAQLPLQPQDCSHQKTVSAPLPLQQLLVEENNMFQPASSEQT